MFNKGQSNILQVILQWTLFLLAEPGSRTPTSSEKTESPLDDHYHQNPKTDPLAELITSMEKCAIKNKKKDTATQTVSQESSNKRRRKRNNKRRRKRNKASTIHKSKTRDENKESKTWNKNKESKTWDEKASINGESKLENKEQQQCHDANIKTENEDNGDELSWNVHEITECGKPGLYGVILLPDTLKIETKYAEIGGKGKCNFQ